MRRLTSIAGLRAAMSRSAAVCVSLVVVIGSASGTSAARANDHGREIARVRAATTGFHDLDVAVAAGYGELADAAGLTCIEDPGGSGAMGIHRVNGALVGDGTIDAEHPEALLFDPNAPNHRLLGVEYVVFVADWGEDRDPPMLFGQEFHLVDAPNRYGLPPFYELHAWIWRHNPSGTFEDWNPRIDCR